MGKTVYSNLWLSFPHTPVKTPYDFLDINEGYFLADELWHLANSRKSASLLNDVINILLLRSRKKGFSVGYTQQHFMQVDKRIRYITDIWVKPTMFLRERHPELEHDILEQEIYDGETLRKLEVRFINPEPFYELFDTKRDPYTLTNLITDKHLREVLGEIEKGVEA